MLRSLSLALVVSLLAGRTCEALATSSTSHNLTLTVNAIILLRVNGAAPTLTVVAPATAGDAPPSVDNSASPCQLQYTSTVTVPATPARRITAAWGAADSAPAGCSLKLRVTGISGGEGSTGSPGPEITVSSSAQDIVTAIGSCYTGTGSGNGANYYYTLSVDNPANLVGGETRTVRLTFTFTD